MYITLSYFVLSLKIPCLYAKCSLYLFFPHSVCHGCPSVSLSLLDVALFYLTFTSLESFFWLLALTVGLTSAFVVIRFPAFSPPSPALPLSTAVFTFPSVKPVSSPSPSSPAASSSGTFASFVFPST